MVLVFSKTYWEHPRWERALECRILDTRRILPKLVSGALRVGRVPRTGNGAANVSSLTTVDRRYLEDILDMGGGYVLDFTDATFAEFFNHYSVNIHSHRYQTYGSSKAKKLRAFWDVGSDRLVGRVLSEMLDNYEADCDLNGRAVDTGLLTKCRAIAARLCGNVRSGKPVTVENFLKDDFKIPDVRKLPVHFTVAELIEGRLKEARLALSAGVHLGVVLLCGSVLEGVLLGAAQQDPARFNRSRSSPKRRDGKVKPLPEWTLAELIDVSCDIGILELDVKKFSHGLRDFRNYIHPYQQIVSGFAPDEHTARVCFQVLRAALASVAGERK